MLIQLRDKNHFVALLARRFLVLRDKMDVELLLGCIAFNAFERLTFERCNYVLLFRVPVQSGWRREVYVANGAP